MADPAALTGISGELARRAEVVRTDTANIRAAWSSVHWVGPSHDRFSSQEDETLYDLMTFEGLISQAAQAASEMAGQLSQELARLRQIELDVTSWLEQKARSVGHAVDAGLQFLGMSSNSLPPPGSPEWNTVLARAQVNGFTGSTVV